MKRYRDDAALFSRFQIEHQIRSAYARTMQLPSGGAIVIDHTEALVSVDVNSAPSRAATSRNRHAPAGKPPTKVARQMRLRDLGGQSSSTSWRAESRREVVENRLRDALRGTRPHCIRHHQQVRPVEMSRQAPRSPRCRRLVHPCPAAGGLEPIRDTNPRHCRSCASSRKSP